MKWPKLHSGLTIRPPGVRIADAFVFATEEKVLQTYTLQLIGPDEGLLMHRSDRAAAFRKYLHETEENLTDLLPEGYSVRIREWDEEETPNE